MQRSRTGAVAIRFCCWSPLEPSPPQANVSRPRRLAQDEAPPAENCMELEFETDDEARHPPQSPCVRVSRCPSSMLLSPPDPRSRSRSLSTLCRSVCVSISSSSLSPCEIIRLCVAFPSCCWLSQSPVCSAAPGPRGPRADYRYKAQRSPCSFVILLNSSLSRSPRSLYLER